MNIKQALVAVSLSIFSPSPALSVGTTDQDEAPPPTKEVLKPLLYWLDDMTALRFRACLVIADKYFAQSPQPSLYTDRIIVYVKDRSLANSYHANFKNIKTEPYFQQFRNENYNFREDNRVVFVFAENKLEFVSFSSYSHKPVGNMPYTGDDGKDTGIFQRKSIPYDQLRIQEKRRMDAIRRCAKASTPK